MNHLRVASFLEHIGQEFPLHGVRGAYDFYLSIGLAFIAPRRVTMLKKITKESENWM